MGNIRNFFGGALLLATVLLFTNCDHYPTGTDCDCGLKGPAWHGSVSLTCGAAGGTALRIRFDQDSITADSARRYRLDPISLVMDSVVTGKSFSDTVEVCENSTCQSHVVRIHVLDASSSNVFAALFITNITNGISGSVATGDSLMLKKDATPPTGPCL